MVIDVYIHSIEWMHSDEIDSRHNNNYQESSCTRVQYLIGCKFTKSLILLLALSGYYDLLYLWLYKAYFDLTGSNFIPCHFTLSTWLSAL